MGYKNLIIREERTEDHSAISDVTKAAFEKMEISNQTEHIVIDELRKAYSLTISLVADLNGKIVGHIAFSPVVMNDCTEDWYGLDPVSVHPDFQRNGVGKALIQEGLVQLKKLDPKGCCLVGHPEYYRQFGFENVEGLIHEGIPQEVFFVLSIDGNIPQGTVKFHEAFSVTN